MENNKTFSFAKSKKKVQLSAKVAPEIHFNMLIRAQKMGLTLSAYTENLAGPDIERVLQEKGEAEKKGSVLEEKVAFLEKNISDHQKTTQLLRENLKNAEVSRSGDIQKAKQGLADQELIALNEQEELIELKKRYINEAKNADKRNQMLNMFYHAALNNKRIRKSELELIFNVKFAELDIHVEGFHFHRVYLNPNIYILIK